MLKRILWTAVLAVLLISCKSKSAFEYSQAIVQHERSLIPDINKTEADVERFIGAQQYDSMAVVSERMEGLVNAKMEEVKAMKVPKAKEADNFRNSAIEYFQYMKSMYTGYKNYAKAGSEEARQVELEKLQQIASGKDKAIEAMQKAQKSYADANGFKIEPGK